MFFISVVWLSALFIEVLGSYISVVGLSSFLGVDLVIMTLAVALDAGKMVIVTLLYKFWSKLPKMMRAYMVPAAIITMIITSVGAFGYLSAAFQKAILPTKTSNIQVVALQDEKIRLQSRKESIDKQIAQLPAESIRGRTKLMNQFKEEQSIVTKRLFEIDRQLPELQAKNVDVESHAGPILYVSQAFNISIEDAVKWIILLIICVFDPLAVILVLCGNFLIEERKRVSNAGAEVTAVIETDEPEIIAIDDKELSDYDATEVEQFKEFLGEVSTTKDPVTSYETVYGVEEDWSSHKTDSQHSFAHSEPSALDTEAIVPTAQEPNLVLAEQIAEMVKEPLELMPIEIKEWADKLAVEPVYEPEVEMVIDEIIDEPKPTVKSEKALNKLVTARSLDDLLKVSEAQIVELTPEAPVINTLPPAEFVSSLSTQSNLPGSEISFDDPIATSRNSNARKLY